MEIKSINEFERNHEAKCYLMMKFDGRQSFNNPVFLECSSSSHSHVKKFIEYIPIEEEMVGYELDDLQHVGEMMVMLGSQYIISPYEPNVFLEEDSFFEHKQHSSSLYESNEVRSLPMIFPQDIFSFYFHY